MIVLPWFSINKSDRICKSKFYSYGVNVYPVYLIIQQEEFPLNSWSFEYPVINSNIEIIFDFFPSKKIIIIQDTIKHIFLYD